MQKKEKVKNPKKKKGPEFPGYPVYPPNQDIYSRAKEEPEIDPESPNHRKPVEELGRLNEKDFSDDVSGADLDIPGAELDDEQENIGSEDEENNHYSLGDNQ
jgi:hypothetical protein